MHARLLAAVTLGLLAARPSLGQDATRAETHPKLDRPLARAVEVVGKGARVWRDGAWSPLRPGDELRAGERIEARKALIDLLLLDDPGAPPGVGARVALGKKARIRLSDTEEGVEVGLEGGKLLGLDQAPLRVRAGRNMIRLEGRAELDLTPGGELHVDLQYGRIACVTNGAERVLEPGKRVRIGSDGSWGKVKSGKRGGPRWARSLFADASGRCLFQERLTPRALEAYTVDWAEPSEGGLRSTEGNRAFGNRMRLRREGGFCTFEPGAKLRLSLYASEAVRVRVTTWASEQKDNFGHPISLVKKGRSVLEIDLSTLTALKNPEVLLKPGTTVATLEFFVGRPGHSITFELSEIMVYVPTRGK